ncbi:MAG: hypothetical protein P8H17_04025 [Flavobacteriales bacterium]|nr:hypothetical protein [Flavobacteriales bacterium]
MKNLKFLLLILPFFFTSCEKDKIEGPNLNDLYGELTILESLDIVGDSADFSNNQSMYFTASFSKQVDWKIKIEGLNSGSVKIISGKSNAINQSNSTWDGSSTEIPFFIAEDCDIQLTFEMHDDTTINHLNIQSPKLYNDENTVLITDFENGFNPNFTGFFQAGCTKSLTVGGSGQGVKFLQQFGTCDWDWLIGYIDYYSTYWYDQNELVNDPSQVYFNIMINGDSTMSQISNIPNSLFKLEFYEDENGDGYYDANTEDRYDYEFDVDWNGWRMISLCYNDVEKLVLATGGGDGVRNPSKISNVRTLLLANPESGFAKADVDFLIWSFGSPILN